MLLIFSPIWSQILLNTTVATQVVLCRMAASNQGSPLRGSAPQGAYNSPTGSPGASAVVSSGALPHTDDSPASTSSAAQSSPAERAYSAQLSQNGRAEVEAEAAVLYESAQSLQVIL